MEDLLPFELRLPGGPLQLDDPTKRDEVEKILFGLQDGFCNAGMALLLFQDEYNRHPERALAFSDLIERRSEAHRQWMVSRDWAKPSKEEEFEHDRAVARKEWTEGIVPFQFLRQLLVMHAKSFVYAADSIGKWLSVFADEEGVPNGADAIVNEFDSDFPDLRMLRDSAQHVEDRYRNKGRGGGDIRTKPLVFRGITMAGMDTTIDQTYATKLTDGRQSTLDITFETLRKLQGHIQKAYDLVAGDVPRALFP